MINFDTCNLKQKHAPEEEPLSYTVINGIPWLNSQGPIVPLEAKRHLKLVGSSKRTSKYLNITPN